jgi:hypothetical protein
MSVLDMVKSKVKEYTDPNGPGADMLNSAKKKVKDYTAPDGPGAEKLNSAKTAVSHGLDGAGKFVDEKTNGKYSDTIHNGVGKARQFLGDKPKDESAHSPDAGADAPQDEPAAQQDAENSTRPSGPDPGSDGSSPPHP